MTYKDLAIYEKTYELLLWIYPTVNKFPKSQRFVLGQHIESTILRILKCIMRANASRRKLPHLYELSLLVDMLKTLMRVARDLNFIGSRQYAFAAERLSEIGKMVGGWIKNNS